MLSVAFDADRQLTAADIDRLTKLMGIEEPVDIGEFLDNPEGERGFYEFFHDALARWPRHRCVLVDWKWEPEDIFQQLETIISGHKVKLIKSNNRQAANMYDITFEIDGAQHSLSIFDERPGDILEGIESLTEGKFISVDFQEDSYAWLYVPKNFSQDDLNEFCTITGCKISQPFIPKPVPKKLSINSKGKQSTTIFFTPRISVIANSGGRELPVTWSGCILPGQTLEEGVAAELKKIYGYTGKFKLTSDFYFLDYATDRQRQETGLYSVNITLFPAEDDKTFDPDRAKQNLLSPEELQRIEWGEALDKDYFYIPVITYREISINADYMWYSLRFDSFDRNPKPESLLMYASKVPAGKTLWQAVRSDLEKDFKYRGNFIIESARPYDTAKNKAGHDLSRVLVDLKVYEMFSTRDIAPLDMQLAWYFEGEDLFGPDLNIDKVPKNSSEASKLLKDPEIKAILEGYNLDYKDYKTKDDIFEALDEIANDWLLNDLSFAEAEDLAEADPATRKAAPNASAIKAKIYNIELKLQKINPEYKPSAYDPMRVRDWNPPRSASIEDFYKEFAYYFGEDKSKIDEAANLYIKFHPEVEIGEVKRTMLK